MVTVKNFFNGYMNVELCKVWVSKYICTDDGDSVWFRVLQTPNNRELVKYFCKPHKYWKSIQRWMKAYYEATVLIIVVNYYFNKLER